MVLVVGYTSILWTSNPINRCLNYCWFNRMPKHKVGEINGNEVVYIPEKDVIFCKNTAVKFPVIERIIRNREDKGEIPEKNLTITKDNGVVHLGCLTTTMENCLDIRRRVNKLKV